MHGKIFEAEDLNAYFNAMSWYCPSSDSDNIDGKLNQYERKNIEMIFEMESKPINASLFNVDSFCSTYILTQSDLRYYSKSELNYLSKAELRLARNEIYARRGNIFKSDDLRAYFSLMSWYNPCKYKNKVESEFNKYEEENITLISDMEKDYGQYCQCGDSTYIYIYYGSYILCESGSRYYSEAELGYLSKSELRLARNEIYAKHGNVFKSDDLKAYFGAMSWYKPKYTDKVESEFNKYEEKNITLISDMEEEYGQYSQDGDCAHAYNYYGFYMLPESASKYYSKSQLSYLSKSELRLARNEIYARHGNIFKSDDLIAYFNLMGWYTPSQYTDEVESEFNKYEEKNITLILDMEEEYGKYSNDSGLTYVYTYHSSYILAESSSRYYSKSQLSYLSKSELRLARNEIYARHGNIFKSDDLKVYFGSMNWYHPMQYTDDVGRELNKYEKKNIATISEMEKSYGSSSTFSGSSSCSRYILNESSIRYYSKSELSSLLQSQLRLARNEIYARHGNIFKSDDLKEYFGSMDWYHPMQYTGAVEREFNKYEEENISRIKDLED